MVSVWILLSEGAILLQRCGISDATVSPRWENEAVYLAVLMCAIDSGDAYYRADLVLRHTVHTEHKSRRGDARLL